MELSQPKRVTASKTALFISAPLLAAGKTELPSADVEPFLPVWALVQHELTVVSLASLIVGDKTVGAMTGYDDATGRRLFTTVKVTSWRFVGLIDSRLKGRR